MFSVFSVATLNLLEMRLWVFLLCLGFSVLDSTRQVYYNQGNCGYPGPREICLPTRGRVPAYRRTGAGIEESR